MADALRVWHKTGTRLLATLEEADIATCFRLRFCYLVVYGCGRKTTEKKSLSKNSGSGFPFKIDSLRI